MSTHRRRALSFVLVLVLVLVLLASIAARVETQGAAGPDPRSRDAIGTAIADLCTGYPNKHLEAARILIADPDAALPQLLSGLTSRPQYERARFIWVISQLGERGRQAILERGADAFRDLAWLHSREREKNAIESLRVLKHEFLKFAMAHLDGPDYTDDRYIVSQALTDLAEPSFVPVYGECLTANPSDKVAVACVKALGAFDSPEAMRALAPALGHRSDEVRRMSRALLVVLGTKAAAAVAAVARKSRSGEVGREEAVRALVEMRAGGENALAELGPAYVPDVISIALKDRDRVSFFAERGAFKQKVDAGISRALERARPIAVPLLVAAMQGEKEPVARGRAIRLLFDLKEPTDLELLVRAQADASSMVRATAIVALGHLGGEAQVPALLEMNSDPSGDVRWTVHWALVTLGAKAIPTLERAAAGTVIGTDRPLPRAPAVRALAYMGEPGLEALRRTHASAFDELMEGLRQIGNDQQASNPLATAIRRVVGAAAATRLLGMVRERSARGGGSEERQAAIRMLAQIADVPSSPADLSPFEVRAVLPSLVPDLVDPCDWARANPSINALGAIRDAEAVKPLLGVLTSKAKCSGWTGVNDTVLESAAIALGKIGDRRAVKPLVRVIENEEMDPIVARAAAAALKRIGDPDGVRVAEEYLNASLRRDRQRGHSEWRAVALAAAVVLFGPLVLAVLRRSAGVVASAARGLLLAVALYRGLSLGVYFWIALASADRASLRTLTAFVALLLLVAVGLRLYPRRGTIDSPGASLAQDFAQTASFTMVGAALWYPAMLSGVAPYLWRWVL